MWINGKYYGPMFAPEGEEGGGDPPTKPTAQQQIQKYRVNLGVPGLKTVEPAKPTESPAPEKPKDPPAEPPKPAEPAKPTQPDPAPEPEAGSLDEALEKLKGFARIVAPQPPAPADPPASPQPPTPAPADPAPAAPEGPKPVEDFKSLKDFLDQDAFKDTFDEPQMAALTTAVDKFGQHLVEQLTRRTSSGIEKAREALLKDIPTIVSPQVSQAVEIQTAVKDFWTRNAQLKPIAPVVQQVANAVETENPGKDINWILEKTEKEVLEVLKSVGYKANGKDGQTTPSFAFAPPPSAQPSPTPGGGGDEGLSDRQKQIKRYLENKNRR